MHIPIEAVYAIVAAIAIFLAGRSAIRYALGKLSAFTTDVQSLTKAITTLAEGNVYLAGQAKVSEAMVAEVTKLRAAISAFTRVVAPGAAADKGDDSVGLSNNRQAEHAVEQQIQRASRAFRRQELEASGLDADQAEAEIAIEEAMESVSL